MFVVRWERISACFDAFLSLATIHIWINKNTLVGYIQIKVQDIEHLGIVAGIIDEMSLVDLFNQLLGTHPQEIISAGQVVKAMILNGLGFISAPLYLFEKFF